MHACSFVDFATLTDAQTAVETMNDKTVSECSIKVELSHSTVSKRNQGGYSVRMWWMQYLVPA